MTERELFAQALEQPDPDRFLADVCAGDDARHRRMILLMREHRRPSGELDGGVGAYLRADGDSNQPLQELQPFLQPATRPDSLGRLGAYDILGVIGQGGCGIVLKAFDETLQRVVAIKVLHPPMARTSPARKRFLREARTAAAIQHEGVVAIHAVHEEPVPFLVMTCIDGRTLQERLLAAGPFEPREVVAIGTQLARALAAAHARGIVHRDVKPANILLESGPGPRVKLTDFGLARTADAASQTQSGVIAGTPQYMSPEQAEGREIDHHTDLFSLGSVLYALTVGHAPFRAPNTLGVLRRIADDTPRPIRQIMPDTPAGLCDVIERLHRKRPADRFPTADDVVAALETCLSGPPASPKRKPSRRRWGIASGVTAAILILGVLAWPYVSSPSATRHKEGPLANTAPEPSPKPVGQQVKELIDQLIMANPDLPRDHIRVGVKDGSIVSVAFEKDRNVFDIAPLGGVATLKLLDLTDTNVDDLSPLKGLRLESLSLERVPVSDLAPLRGMPLAGIAMGHSQVRNLAPLQGMPLDRLFLHGAPIESLEPLRGMTTLVHLDMRGIRTGDIAPLAGLPLEILRLEYDAGRHRETLRSIATLRQINDRAATDVLTAD